VNGVWGEVTPAEVLNGVEGLILAEIKKTTAYDHIQPLFEELVAECHRQEGYAEMH
jgi:hypothetical protein